MPNGIFVDEEGTIRLIKQGFKVGEQEHVQAIEKLINKEVETVELEDIYYEPKSAQQHLQLELAKTKFKLGMEYLSQQKKEEALRELDEAIRLDPDNFLIRKQRWYIRYPEKFKDPIDVEWQQAQLKQEREEEANCGPDGCEIPGTDQK
ncbi:tetratricopeptide repeat protein [Pseudalkalibacillus sp. R45]|uniref:tetratricopeptide repeat protein n=1 Tax=Pseudalkalibacillus sp. R45 TaxID=3457433 RepID=UPI003FCED0FB